MLSADTFLHVCVCKSVHTPAQTTHTHTLTRTVAYTGLAHLWRTPPPCRSTLLRSFYSLFLVQLGGGVRVSCPLGERSEWDRWMERKSEEEETNLPKGPQLASAMVSMTCSSLHLSLCLLACSSRSSADRICRRKGQKVRWSLVTVKHGRVCLAGPTASSSPRPCT